MSKLLYLGITIGAALGSSWQRTMGGATKSLHQLGATARETDKKLKAARAVIDYKAKLEALRAKQTQRTLNMRASLECNRERRAQLHGRIMGVVGAAWGASTWMG